MIIHPSLQNLQLTFSPSAVTSTAIRLLFISFLPLISNYFLVKGLSRTNSFCNLRLIENCLPFEYNRFFFFYLFKLASDQLI